MAGDVLRAEATVSAWLTRQRLGFSTNALDNARVWQVPFGQNESGKTLLPLVLYVGGSTFGASVALRAVKPEDAWHDDVRKTLGAKVPYIHITPYRDQQDVEHPEIVWVKVEVPIDLSFELPILPGTMYQAVASVHTAGTMILGAFAGRFEGHELTWINIPVTTVPADEVASGGTPSKS